MNALKTLFARDKHESATSHALHSAFLVGMFAYGAYTLFIIGKLFF